MLWPGPSRGEDVLKKLQLSRHPPGCRGCLGEDTLQWVAEQAAALPRVPSVAFFHIPIPQFLELWNLYPTNGERAAAQSSSVSAPAAAAHVLCSRRQALWRLLVGGKAQPAAPASACSAGTKDEQTACLPIDTGAFDILR